jgi:hypothetical protein
MRDNAFEYHVLAIRRGSPLYKLIHQEAELSGSTRIAPMLRSRLERSYEHDNLVDRIVGKLGSMSIITQQVAVAPEEPPRDNADDALEVWE